MAIFPYPWPTTTSMTSAPFFATTNTSYPLVVAWAAVTTHPVRMLPIDRRLQARVALRRIVTAANPVASLRVRAALALGASDAGFLPVRALASRDGRRRRRARWKTDGPA